MAKPFINRNLPEPSGLPRDPNKDTLPASVLLLPTALTLLIGQVSNDHLFSRGLALRRTLERLLWG